MSTPPALVIGASGFLGSHVVRQLVADNRPVRALVRRSSRLDALGDLAVEIVYGDVMDPASLRAAMAGVGTVFHCVVDTRAWLSDPTPLFRTNVDGLVNAMDAALATGVQRFVFTSSIATIGLNPNGPATEDHAFNWAKRAPAYVHSRVQAEDALLRYCREHQLPGVALCVANTYGPDDFQPTPHGRMLWDAATGRLPVALNCGAPVVDVRDAARALILAEQRGTVGERYIISGEFISQPALFALATRALGRRPPPRMPVSVAYAIAWLSQSWGKLRGVRDMQLCTDSVLLSHVFKAMDASKARDALGWTARPIAESVADAMAWYAAQLKD